MYQLPCPKLTLILKSPLLKEPLLDVPEELNNFDLAVDYSISLEQMVALGRFDWTNEKIIENFEKSGTGNVTLSAKIFRINCRLSTEGVVVEMGKEGLRPATLMEIIAFGVNYPEVQRCFSIMALGSYCKISGYCYVPYLCELYGERNLNLSCSDGGWNEGCHFLAIRT